MRILFVVRADSSSKPGGDLIQVEAYASAMKKMGVQVDIVPWSPTLRFEPDAIAGLVNIDRPYEFVDAARKLRGSPYFVLPIHHSSASIAALRRDESRISKRRRAINLLGPSLRELLTFVRRVSKLPAHNAARISASLRALPTFVLLRVRVRAALRGASFAVYLSEAERASVLNDFAVLPSAHVIAPNGVTSEHSAKSWQDRVRRAVVVGRIEPRKRQLQFMAAAEAVGFPVVFIGKVDENSGAYGDEFVSRVGASTVCEWWGALPQSEALQAMRDSRVLANPSWAEVQSLVELEAAVAGCFVVTFDSGSASEYLSEVADIVPLDEPVSTLAQRVSEVLERSYAPPAFEYEHSWDTSASKILQAAEEYSR